MLVFDTPSGPKRRHYESLGSERLTGALLDRLTHHVHILQMNSESYRLNQSKSRSRRASSDTPADNPAQV